MSAETKSKMKKTIDVIKSKRKVPDDLKAMVKEYNRIKKAIISALKEGSKTIPQVAKETGLLPEVVTYHLMTLRKYGDIEADEIDDMDEYYYYKLAKKE